MKIGLTMTLVLKPKHVTISVKDYKSSVKTKHFYTQNSYMFRGEKSIIETCSYLDCKNICCVLTEYLFFTGFTITGGSVLSR